MNIAVNKLFQWVAAAALGFGLIAQPAMTQDMPANEFVEKFSNEVLAEIKARKQELLADPKKLDALIDQKVMPNVNFRKMTQLVVGRPWREATPEQREQITKEFRTLLVKTYSGALAQVGDQTLQVDRLQRRKPLWQAEGGQRVALRLGEEARGRGEGVGRPLYGGVRMETRGL